jgi:hypothetical protein
MKGKPEENFPETKKETKHESEEEEPKVVEAKHEPSRA